MSEAGRAKVFDVGKPQPSPTSKPIIVGQRPVVTDPMMRRPSVPAPAQPPSRDIKIINIDAAKRAEIQQTMKPLASQPIVLPPAAQPIPELDSAFQVRQLTAEPDPTVNKTGRAPHWLIWVVAGLVLVIVALYIAIDGGFINTGWQLPFHVFSRQS
jgi:hypothetical protein